jgi:hypothetical protein
MRVIDQTPDARFDAIECRVVDLLTAAGVCRGPYYSLRYRTGGRQRSLYLGASVELKERVQRLLDRLQSRTRHLLALKRFRRAVVASLQNQRRILRAQFAELGLELIGWRVRRGLKALRRSLLAMQATDSGRGLFSPAGIAGKVHGLSPWLPSCLPRRPLIYGTSTRSA